MNSKEYWERREAEALNNRITDEKEYEKRLREIYTNMLDGVQSEINSFYGKYATKEGITIAEAKKRVKQADIAEYERKAKRYVKAAERDRQTSGKTDKNAFYFSEKANEEMRLYNLTMKVNRLEMLKANIGLEMIKGHAELETFMQDILQGRTEDELKRQAGILGKTIKNNAKTANAIVNASFHNATFSDRIWQYHDLMKNDLSNLLQTGLIQGKNPRALAKDLKKYYFGDEKKNGGALFATERLMRTELARVQTEAQKQSFIKNGFEMYTFHTNTGCCDICAAINGKHYKIKDMQIGENAPPMHPHCRCSTSAYEDSAEYERWLDFLANGGTTEEHNKLKAQREMLTNRRKERLAARQAQTATPDFDSMNRTEIVQWAEKNLKTKFEDVKGANTDFIKEAVKVISTLEKKMGGNTINGLSVKFGKVPNGDQAKYDDKTHTVLLKKTGSIQNVLEYNQKTNARARLKLGKDYFATETYSGVLWHELGHAVDCDTAEALSKSLSANREIEAKSVAISVYAGSTQNVRVSKRSEAWAENFAAYMEGGANKQKVPPEIAQMIEDYFKQKRSKTD